MRLWLSGVVKENFTLVRLHYLLNPISSISKCFFLPKFHCFCFRHQLKEFSTVSLFKLKLFSINNLVYEFYVLFDVIQVCFILFEIYCNSMIFIIFLWRICCYVGAWSSSQFKLERG
jgi:hypothetical protein